MNPWEANADIWPTQSKFMSWVRGGIRRGLWLKHPVKLSFLGKRLARQLVGKYKNGKDKWQKLGVCELCENSFPAAKLEVDHKEGNHSLRTMDDVQHFIESMIMVTEENLQLVCKDCHSIKSYADKQEISFAEAKLEKEIIVVKKLKATAQNTWLQKHGVTPAKNAAGREEQIREILKREH